MDAWRSHSQFLRLLCPRFHWRIGVTAKELDLLKLLVEHEGLVLSRTQILDGVWGDDSYVLDRLVDTYIKNLRKKLHLDCIKTVKGIGYKLEVSQ